MVMRMKKISVILPCFNERENIVKLINEIHSVLLNWDHEIIVVDDNSPDGTYSVVKGMGKYFVSIYNRKGDRGLAKSLRFGIEHSVGDWIVLMDSDFNHRPEELPQMISNLNYFQCVLGSRFVYGGKMGGQFRHFASWCFNIFIRLLTQKYITDNLYGFIAIRRDVLINIEFCKVFWGFGDYSIRLIYYLQDAGVSILQTPAVLGKRLNGEGNRRFFKTFVSYTKETLILILKKRGKQRVHSNRRM